MAEEYVRIPIATAKLLHPSRAMLRPIKVAFLACKQHRELRAMLVQLLLYTAGHARSSLSGSAQVRGEGWCSLLLLPNAVPKLSDQPAAATPSSGPHVLLGPPGRLVRHHGRLAQSPGILVRHPVLAQSLGVPVRHPGLAQSPGMLVRPPGVQLRHPSSAKGGKT